MLLSDPVADGEGDDGGLLHHGDLGAFVRRLVGIHRDPLHGCQRHRDRDALAPPDDLFPRRVPLRGLGEDV